MKQTNDDLILRLKKQIDEKRNKLKKNVRFSPHTNCSLELYGQRHNIQVLNLSQLIHLAATLHALQKSATELEIVDMYIISGYKISEWITDIMGKIEHSSRREEEAKLKVMEHRLQQLLSVDKQVELELDDIQNTLKTI